MCHRLSCLEEGSEVGPRDEAEDDIYERMDEFGRKAITFEEEFDADLRSLFVRTRTLDLRANFMEESFEKAANRFVEQAFAIQSDVGSVHRLGARLVGISSGAAKEQNNTQEANEALNQTATLPSHARPAASEASDGLVLSSAPLNIPETRFSDSAGCFATRCHAHWAANQILSQAWRSKHLRAGLADGHPLWKPIGRQPRPRRSP